MRYGSPNVESKMPFRVAFSCNFCGNTLRLWITMARIPQIVANQVGSWLESALFLYNLGDTKERRTPG